MADGPFTDGALARSLRRLIASARPQGAVRWSYADVAEAINTYHGHEVIKWRYLYALATGRKAQPNLQLVQQLAAFFHVTADELMLAGPQELDEDERLVRAALTDARLRGIVRILQATPRAHWSTIEQVIALARQTLDAHEAAVVAAMARDDASSAAGAHDPARAALVAQDGSAADENSPAEPALSGDSRT